MAKDEILSIEEVAKRIGLHPKTVRKHITDGKLPARKVGRQWRVLGSDLERFVGGDEASPKTTDLPALELADVETDPSRQRAQRIRVTSVVDVFVSGKEEADRIETFVFASMNSAPDPEGSPRCDYIFFPKENKARFIFWGSPKFMSDMLACLEVITDQ